MLNKFSGFCLTLYLCIFCLSGLAAEDSEKNIQAGMSDMIQESDFSDVEDVDLSSLVIDALDFGFVFDSFKVDEFSASTTAFGPFYNNIDFPNGSKFWAIRPFYSYDYDSDNDRTVRDFIWPLGSDKIFNDERLTRVLTYYKLDYDMSNPYSSYAASVFPLLFWGKGNNEKSYFALFPIAGRIGNFLGMNDIEFLLAPAYVKYRTNKMTSTSVLWPIFNYTTGPGVKRYRVWPFYGRNINEDVWAKHFVLWPIWTDVTYHLEGGKGYSFILFPLFGRTKTQNQSTLWLAPPLIRFTDSEVQKLVYCPWQI
jgi:hypothetical protein